MNQKTVFISLRGPTERRERALRSADDKNLVSDGIKTTAAVKNFVFVCDDHGISSVTTSPTPKLVASTGLSKRKRKTPSCGSVNSSKLRRAPPSRACGPTLNDSGWVIVGRT